MEEVLVWEFLGVFLSLSALTYSALLILRSTIGRRLSSAVEQTLIVLTFTFLWYAISLSFTLYNKWLLQEWRGGFDFPVLITSVHMTLKWIVAQLWKCVTREYVAALPTSTVLAVVFPIGAFTAMDIVCSNFAVYFLPLSMYTTIKGSTLMFTFFWAVVCGVQRFSFPLFGAVTAICTGLILAIGSSTMVLSPLGILFAFASAAAGGLRWVLVQVLAVRDPQSRKVMVSLYRFSPYGAVSIIPFAIGMDIPAVADSDFGRDPSLMVQALLFCVLGGAFAFALIVVEVRLLRETSSLTMSVIGQIKEIVQIGAAMLIFGDNISIRSGLGIALSIAASCYYRQLAIKYSAEEKIDETAKNRHRQSRGQRKEVNARDVEAIRDDSGNGLLEESTIEAEEASGFMQVLASGWCMCCKALFVESFQYDSHGDECFDDSEVASCDENADDNLRRTIVTISDMHSLVTSKDFVRLPVDIRPQQQHPPDDQSESSNCEGVETGRDIYHHAAAARGGVYGTLQSNKSRSTAVVMLNESHDADL